MISNSQTLSTNDLPRIAILARMILAEPDDKLYSGAPMTSRSSTMLLLSFVFKHKLTREAFNDLLQVIEAHCPRPNSCKLQLQFEFESKTKGDTVVKNYYFQLLQGLLW